MHRGIHVVRGCKGAREGGQGGSMYVHRQGARAGESCTITRRYAWQIATETYCKLQQDDKRREDCHSPVTL